MDYWEGKDSSPIDRSSSAYFGGSRRVVDGEGGSDKRTDFYCCGWQILWQTFVGAFGGAGGGLGGD